MSSRFVIVSSRLVVVNNYREKKTKNRYTHGKLNNNYRLGDYVLIHNYIFIYIFVLEYYHFTCGGGETTLFVFGRDRCQILKRATLVSLNAHPASKSPPLIIYNFKHFQFCLKLNIYVIYF